jgi:RHS repeat-associated protein
VAGTQNAVPVYRIGDHLGSLALSSTTDTFSGVTGIASTLPFGETAANTGGDNFPFTDHERDSENGADATTFRHYSPAQSRWLSPDPFNGSYDIADPQSLNRYAYLTNRPMNATDPTGLDDCPTGTQCLSNPGSGGSSNAPSGGDFSGDSGIWGSNSGPVVTGGYAGGGAYSGLYSPMTSSYSAPGAYIQADWTQSMLDTHSASEEFAANLIFPFETFGETLDNFRQQNYWKATGYALLTLPGLIPDVGAEEKTALTAGDQVLARTNGIREGIYEFISSNGQKYIGQSGNIYSRLMQHIQQGKLAIQDIDSIVAKEVLGGKTAREIEEQLSILRNGRIPNLRNQVNPIGAARGNLLPQWAKSILGYK